MPHCELLAEGIFHGPLLYKSVFLGVVLLVETYPFLALHNRLFPRTLRVCAEGVWLFWVGLGFRCPACSQGTQSGGGGGLSCVSASRHTLAVTMVVTVVPSCHQWNRRNVLLHSSVPVLSASTDSPAASVVLSLGLSDIPPPGYVCLSVVGVQKNCSH